MNDWKTAELGEILTLNYGCSLPKDKRVSGNVPVYGSNGVVGTHNTPIVESSGIIVGRKGSAGAVHFSAEPFCPIDTTFFVAPKDTSLDLKFTFYLIRHLNLKRILGDVGVPGLNREAAYQQKVRCPQDRKEQRAIAGVLEKLQTAVTALQAIIDRTAELKAALMAKLFTEGTRDGSSIETRFGIVPRRWTVEPLESCAVVQTGVAKGRKLGTAKILEVPYLRVANVQDGHLDLAEIKKIQLRESELPRYKLRAGDVVLTEGGDFDKLGRGFIWHGQIDPCVHQNHVFAVRVDRSRLMPAFMAYLCQSPYGRSYFLNVAHKTTNLACINTAKLKALPTLIPDLAEQREIVESLDVIQAKIDVANRRRTLFAELFAAMLDALMTGRIRVGDAELLRNAGTRQRILD